MGHMFFAWLLLDLLSTYKQTVVKVDAYGEDENGNEDENGKGHAIRIRLNRRGVHVKKIC